MTHERHESDGMNESNLLYESETTRISLLRDVPYDLDDGTTEHVDVVSKASLPCASDAAVAKLRNEFDILTGALPECDAVRPALQADEGDDGRSLTVYLQYADGVTLREWMVANPPPRLPPRVGPGDGDDGSLAAFLRTLRLAREVSSALAMMHECGVVHKDFSADNIVVYEGRLRGERTGLRRLEEERGDDDGVVDGGDGEDGEGEGNFIVKIIDLGEATVVGDDEDVGACGVCDRVGYRPRPEDGGPARPDLQPDLQSLGALMYKLFSGRDPFAAAGRHESAAGGEDGTDVRNDAAVDQSQTNAGPASIDADAAAGRGQEPPAPPPIHSALVENPPEHDRSEERTVAAVPLHELGLPHSLASVVSALLGSESWRRRFPPEAASLTMPPPPPDRHCAACHRSYTGGNDRDAPYASAAAVAEDLGLMIADPGRFLFDRDPDAAPSHLEFKSTRLYGRDDEIAALMSAFHQVVEPEPPSLDDDLSRDPVSEMVLVSGSSGSGKSALVERLRGPVTERGGYFLCGKFDQLQRSEPYSALADAFSGLCDLFLAGDAQTLAEIRAAVKESVGSQGKVLVDVIPRLARCFTDLESEDVADIGEIESQNRFNFVFRRFARAICSPSHPVVLFLDDLQWSDVASLELIKTLVTDTDNSNLLFIGCFRETSTSMLFQPFAVQLHELEKMKNIHVTKIKVRNLSKETVNALISDTVCVPRRLTLPLTDIVYSKTHGNVFFVIQLLKALENEGLLYFCFESMQWRWDVEQIKTRNFSEDVAVLLASKIRKLPVKAQNILKMAACIGSTFDEATLKVILHASVDGRGNLMDEHGDLDRVLDMAFIEGMIDKTGSKFRFAHDQIQQAAYQLIPDKSERDQLHLWIGKLIWKNLSANTLVEDHFLFVAADQLNRGVGVISDQDERIDLARLNLRAGNKAKASSAFATAGIYLKTGIDLLGPGHWEKHYELSLELFNSCGECEYANGSFDKMEFLLKDIFTQARSLKDKLRAYTTLISSLSVQDKLQNAIDIGFDVMAQLGEPFPRSVGMHNILAGLAKTKMMLRGKTCSSLTMLNEMEDETKRAAMTMMSTTSASIFVGRPKYVPLVVFRMVQLSLRYGVCKTSAFGFAAYGLMSCGVLGDPKTGYEFGRLGLSLLERFGANDTLPLIYITVYGCINHWTEHLELSLDPLLYGYQVGMEVGDIEHAMFCAREYLLNSYHCGRPLAPLVKEMKAYHQQMFEYSIDAVLSVSLPVAQAALNLMGRSDNVLELTGDAMQQEETLEEATEKENVVEVCLIQFNRLLLAYIFGNYELAVELAEESRKVDELALAKVEVWVHRFYESLSAFAMARKRRQRKWISRAQKAKKKFKKWAKYSQQNMQHKYHLLAAESAALKGKRDKASLEYSMAIEAAGEHRFLQDKAIAEERAGMFYLEIGDEEQSRNYYTQAYQSFCEWGAQAKADQLKNDFPHLVDTAHDTLQNTNAQLK